MADIDTSIPTSRELRLLSDRPYDRYPRLYSSDNRHYVALVTGYPLGAEVFLLDVTRRQWHKLLAPFALGGISFMRGTTALRVCMRQAPDSCLVVADYDCDLQTWVDIFRFKDDIHGAYLGEPTHYQEVVTDGEHYGLVHFSLEYPNCVGIINFADTSAIYILGPNATGKLWQVRLSAFSRTGDMLATDEGLYSLRGASISEGLRHLKAATKLIDLGDSYRCEGWSTEHGYVAYSGGHPGRHITIGWYSDSTAYRFEPEDAFELGARAAVLLLDRTGKEVARYMTKPPKMVGFAQWITDETLLLYDPSIGRFVVLDVRGEITPLPFAITYE